MADETQASTTPDPGQQPTPPPSAPPQSVDVNTPAPQPVQTEDAPQSDQTIQPDSAGDAPTAAAGGTPPKQPFNLAKSVYHGVLSALGGSQETSYQRDPQTGKMIVTQTPSGTGTQWKRIIAGAITGMGAGLQATPGPGQLERAAGAGVSSTIGTAAKQDQQKQDQANTDYDTQQKTLVQKAQTQLLTYQGATAAFQLGRMKVQAAQENSAMENSFNKLIQDGGNGSQDLGVAKNFADVLSMHKDMPGLVKENAQGNIIQAAHVNGDGQFDGTRFALVTPQWKDAKLTTDTPFYSLQPATKMGEQPTIQKQTVKAGTMSNGDFANRQTASSNEILKWQTDHEKQLHQDKIDAATIAEKRATTTKNYAEAAKTAAETNNIKNPEGMDDNAIVDGMIDGTVDVTKVASIRGARREQLITAAKAKDPSFTMQKYNTMLGVQKDFSGNGQASQQIQSFNAFLGHADDLSNSINGIRNSASPLINTPINKLKEQATGNPAIKEFLTQITASKTEFQNFLNNNHALLAQDKEEGQKLLNENMSPAALQGQMRQFVTTASIRMSAINHTYYRTFGKDAPDMLDEDGKAALAHFGVPESMVYHHPTGYAAPASKPAQQAPQAAAGGFDWNAHPKAQ